MKKPDKILVYDDYCPLCTWYSGLFVKYRFLPAEGRIAFSSLDPETISKIDIEKGRNEIPLIDISTGKVKYGIDALLEILHHKIPFIKFLGNLEPINWFLKKLYKLVSYNRKVIVAKKCGKGVFDCSPDFNSFYRIFFMIISLAFNTLMLFPLHTYIFSSLSFYDTSLYELQIAHMALVGINCFLTLSFTKEKAIEYLGQVNMLALLSILLLLPLFAVKIVQLNEPVIVLYLICLTVFIFKEYLRRMEYAGVLPENKLLVSINLASLSGFILFLF